nr:zinc/iron permease [Tanacetum cinerariifolium]
MHYWAITPLAVGFLTSTANGDLPCNSTAMTSHLDKIVPWCGSKKPVLWIGLWCSVQGPDMMGLWVRLGLMMGSDTMKDELDTVAAFSTAAVMRTQAKQRKAIQGIQEHLLGVPIQEELTDLRFKVNIIEGKNASLRTRIKTMEAIKEITRKCERQARVEIEKQLATVQESQRQDRENFQMLKELVTSQFRKHS